MSPKQRKQLADIEKRLERRLARRLLNVNYQRSAREQRSRAMPGAIDDIQVLVELVHQLAGDE